MADSIVAATTKYLLSLSAVVDAVGESNTIPAVPFIFQNNLKQVVERSSSVALVVSRRGNWASANPYNTVKTPRVSITMFVDPLRDSSGNVTDLDGSPNRGDAVWDIIDKYLHRPSAEIVTWGDLRVLGSTRLNEPTWNLVKDGDLMVWAEVLYGVLVG